MIQWVESLGLADFATNLRESGVHGGVIALDSDFDHDKLALALQIPLASTEVRGHNNDKINRTVIITVEPPNKGQFGSRYFCPCFFSRGLSIP